MRARTRRKKIHAIHKANIMKLSDGLFLRCAAMSPRNIPRSYGEHIVDNTCMQLVMNPDQFDVLVHGKSLRRIISRSLRRDSSAAWASCPAPTWAMSCAIFEAVHGSAPDIAGKNLANPTAVIRSAQLMLRHLGEHHAADKIHDGLEKVYRTKDKLTRDVGGKAGTSEFADAIIQFMETSTDVPPQAESSHA